MTVRTWGNWREEDGIRYRARRGLLTDGGVVLEATYCSTVMTLVDGEDADGPWLSIWSMASLVQNHGHCQRMIAQLRVEWPNHALYGSVPIHPAARHIFDKHHVCYPKED